ncbi:MAG: hypothetical protein OEW08_05185 [Gammaproteobacteria bacterium]|nr:hypothetical protein [Gammaproteobacteria bacterium]
MRNFFVAFSIVNILVMASARAEVGNVSDTPFPPLAAHYTEILKSKNNPSVSSDWYLVRRPGQVETSRDHYSEVWQRDTRGELTLTRVFHQDRKLIHYTAGELRTQHREKDWDALNGVVAKMELNKLKRIADTVYQGRPATRYAGHFGDEKIDVLWLNKESLAAKYVHTYNDRRVTLELKDLQAHPIAAWPQANPKKIEPYDYIDGADLGDMEYDPFVRRVLASDGH